MPHPNRKDRTAGSTDRNETASSAAVFAMSGPPRADLPYRYGCTCGAVWNAPVPIDTPRALCGPGCVADLFPLGDHANEEKT